MVIQVFLDRKSGLTKFTFEIALTGIHHVHQSVMSLGINDITQHFAANQTRGTAVILNFIRPFIVEVVELDISIHVSYNRRYLTR